MGRNFNIKNFYVLQLLQLSNDFISKHDLNQTNDDDI